MVISPSFDPLKFFQNLPKVPLEMTSLKIEVIIF